MTNLTRRALLGAGIPLAALVLSACSNGTDGGHGSMMSSSNPMSSGSAMSDHSQADVMFSTMMIPHHEQAVEMAGLVPTRSKNAEVLALAEQIKGAQQPEIDQMNAWLKEWGAPMPGGMDHSSHGGMSGMMSEEDMAGLEAASGADFDRMWLEMMIEHHEGAIEMAENVRSQGSHAGTRTMADAIIKGQQAEIDQMKAMLAS